MPISARLAGWSRVPLQQLISWKPTIVDVRNLSLCPIQLPSFSSRLSFLRENIMLIRSSWLCPRVKNLPGQNCRQQCLLGLERSWGYNLDRRLCCCPFRRLCSSCVWNNTNKHNDNKLNIFCNFILYSCSTPALSDLRSIADTQCHGVWECAVCDLSLAKRWQREIHSHHAGNLQ